MINTIRQHLTKIVHLSQQLLDIDLPADMRQDFLVVYQAASIGMPDVLAFIESQMSGKTFLQAVSQCSSQWRTPISTISGYCQFALEGFYGPLTDEQMALVVTIDKLAESLGKLSAPPKDYDPDAADS
jgi:hypothetical protein